jgi:RHS repeat-associated protein
LGRRIAKSFGDVVNWYVYDGNAIIAAYNSSGTVTARYAHGLNIDEPLAVQRRSVTSYYHADGLGSIVALTNAAGSIVQTYSYDSFGNITPSGGINQPFTYTAREYDYETGLYYYRARYYDPKAGRFITKDPISFAGGDVNLYGYVRNNPINRLDPLGLYETLFGQHYFEGADVWPWYGGWPFNGSPLPGYSEQDNVCSYPAGYFNKNACTKKCCKAHDDCYRRHGCNASSWLGIPFFLPGACQMCNQQVELCIARNVGNDDCKCK